MISTEKQMLRLQMRESLRTMTPCDRDEKSARVAAILAERLRGEEGVIFGFVPLRSEPNWTACAGASWKIAFPRSEGETLRFLLTNELGNFTRGPHGTREPESGVEMLPRDATILLVPGLAFDCAGGRLGRGGGFYDRLLATPGLTALRIGICFACQIVERVPVELHDAVVDVVVTERGWIDVRNIGSGPG